MLRAMFFAIGTFLTLTGLLLFHVDRVVLTHGSAAESTLLAVVSSAHPTGSREIDPPSWLPYTLVSTGILTMLYAVALPRKPG